MNGFGNVRLETGRTGQCFFRGGELTTTVHGCTLELTQTDGTSISSLSLHSDERNNVAVYGCTNTSSALLAACTDTATAFLAELQDFTGFWKAWQPLVTTRVWDFGNEEQAIREQQRTAKFKQAILHPEETE